MHLRCGYMDRGQVSIEAILLIGFFVLIFVSITFPAALKVSSASNDVAAVMEAQSNLNKVSSAVEAVAVGQRGTVRTITIVSNIANWEINTNALTDGTYTILNYEIGIWNSTADVPPQLYRIRSGGDGTGWGAVTVLTKTGISTGSSAGLGQRKCSHLGNGKGTWTVRVENAANSSAPYIVFDTSNPSADCTASNTINMYLIG